MTKRNNYRSKSYKSSSYRVKTPKTGKPSKKTVYDTKPTQKYMKKASYKPRNANPKGDWRAACGSSKKAF